MGLQGLQRQSCQILMSLKNIVDHELTPDSIQNLDTFYQAFNIKEGDGMFISPDKRVKIW